MKLDRSKLRVEELERRDTPTAVVIGHSPLAPATPAPVLHFQVAGYDLYQVNGSAPTTSSAFGFSEASMTGPQVVTTAGGSASLKLTDAFDGALSWGLAQSNGTPVLGTNGPLTYTDIDGTVDIVGTAVGGIYGSGTIVTGSRETANAGGDTFGGLQLWQQNALFSVNFAPVIRTIFFVNNPNSAPVTQNFGVFNNLGSNEPDISPGVPGPDRTTIYATSSGDTLFAPGVDTWVGSFDNYTGTPAPDPRLLFQLRGSFGTIKQGLDASSVFVDGDDNPHFNFNTTLQGGETKAYMVFTGLYGSKSAALSNNVVFSSYTFLRDSGLLAGLGAAEVAQIQNWDLVAPAVTPPPRVAAAITGAAVAPQNGPSNVVAYSTNGEQSAGFIAFPGYSGSVEVARGDVNGDGVLDLIVAVGAGGAPQVKVFSGADGGLLQSFYAYDASFLGGVAVASADVNRDGFADIIVGTQTGASHVKVFSGANGGQLASFLAFDGFGGGVSVAGGDLDRDGFADIVVGTRTGSSHVKAFSLAQGALIRSFIAYDGYTGGVNVAAGDLNGDGYAEIVTGARTFLTHVKVFNGANNALAQSFYAYDTYPSGVSVAVTDVDGDGRSDIATGVLNGVSHYKAFRLADLALLRSFLAFDASYTGGIDVA